LSGCARITPIENLALPPVTVIEGAVTQSDDKGFTLKDQSGSIYVRVNSESGKGPAFKQGEALRVYGNLQGGSNAIFDSYVIEKDTGEQVIVNMPSPHFGFIFQTSFKK